MTATRWPSQTLQQELAPDLPGVEIEIVAEIDSTNAELMRRARMGRFDPTLLIAEHQLDGRGRMGRQWTDRPDAAGEPGCLMFSLGVMLSPQDWSGLSLAVGLSLAESLHPEIALKWPNDLWWHDRKLAGVLVETVSWGGDAPRQSRYTVIGAGINIATPEANGLATAPAGLCELTKGVHAAQALQSLAAPLVRALRQFEQHGFGPLRAAFNARDALAGVAVTLSDGQQGTAHGVDASGALLVQTASGMQRVTSAEVSVRPLAPPGAHLV